MNDLKTCTLCGIEKTLSEFHRRRDAPNATHRAACKRCHYEKTRRLYYKQLRAAQDAWRARNRARVNAQARINNKTARQKYPEKNTELCRRRAARELGAVPPWADKVAIVEIYRKARILSKTTGIQHQVDHIIPLIHPLVCGLHVGDNLQILTIHENARKRNLFSIGATCL